MINDESMSLYNPYDDEEIIMEAYGEEEGRKIILDDCKRVLEAYLNEEMRVSAREHYIIERMFNYFRTNADLTSLNLKYLHYLESKI